MRTCIIDGCDKKHRAKGLCSTHYNQQHQPDRHKPKTVQCAGCGTAILKNGGGKRRPVCSLMCRYYVTHGKWQTCLLPTKCLLPSDHPGRAVRQPKPFTCGWCEECGRPWVSKRTESRFCSSPCKVKSGRRRRRAREHNAPGNFRWIEVVALHLRLNRCCYYCQLPTADFEPDHVIPLSRGGTNYITNIVPACGLCNADKRDLLIDEWNADRIRRGLTGVNTNPPESQFYFAA